MRRQAKLAGMRGQRFVIARRMLDRMRPGQQLGEDERGNEQEMTPDRHSFSGLRPIVCFG